MLDDDSCEWMNQINRAFSCRFCIDHHERINMIGRDHLYKTSANRQLRTKQKKPLQFKSVLMMRIDVFPIRVNSQFDRIHLLHSATTNTHIVADDSYLQRTQEGEHETQSYQLQHNSLMICNYNHQSINRAMREEKQQKIDVTVHPTAYKKIVYHLVRYPTSKVTGVLVGKKHQILDAFPLFHTPIVNPTLSVALDLIESNLDSSLSIIGLYEFVEGNEPKINSIIENNPQFKQMINMRVWSNLEKEIVVSSPRFNFLVPEWSVVAEGLKKGEYRFLVDFDAHFEEIELDFRNTYVK